MNQPEAIVQVRNLRKVYDGTTALADASLEIASGEIVGLLGANGAGKTTLIHILLGLLTPTSGTVSVFGTDLQHHRISILERCNFSSCTECAVHARRRFPVPPDVQYRAIAREKGLLAKVAS